MLPDDCSGESVAPVHAGTANLTPFPKGVSGNPLGKPPGTKNRATIAKELLEVQLAGNSLDGKEGKFSVEYLVNAALLRKAMTGDVQAYKELQDTVYGKIQDSTKISGDPEAPLAPAILQIQLIKPNAPSDT